MIINLKRATKVSLLPILPLLFAASCIAQRPLTEKEAVDYAKAIDVKTLDPTLSSQRLDQWLKSGSPHVDSLRWLSDETCDNKAFGDEEFPRCVRIEFARGGQSGYFLVLIGTRKKGILGPPRLYVGIGVQEEVFVQTGSTDHLSGLAHLLDQPLVAPVVRHLFDEIVALHPIGIPTGADRAAISPFLSKRLSQQLDTAQACQDDYFQQHNTADRAPKPAWLDTGIFVGDSERAIPFSENVTSQEPQKNGSTWVNVVLTYDKAWVDRGGGVTPDYKWWVVTATVIPEDNRLVVDDIRLYDGLATDAPSHRLSQTFAGCDGPHWTGHRVDNKPPAALPLPHYTDWTAINVLRSAAYKQELGFAKAVDIRQLDSSLPSQRLDVWLKSASLHLDHIEWNAGGCNIKEGHDGATRNPDGGLCAWISFQRGNARAHLKISKNSSDPSKLTYLRVEDKDDGLLTPIEGSQEKPSNTNRLSDLPHLLDEEAVIDVTRTLYDAVVANHPLGSPHANFEARIKPLLSNRLNQQLEAAKVCRHDNLRQNPGTRINPNLAWPNVGLFSGGGELALPTAELVDQKERQDDGSFRVTVWLSRQIADVDPAITTTRWKNWRVLATVRSDGGQSVVDDVRIFDGLTLNSPSHLLSDSFSSCDGPNRSR
jgi:hypothetical protein